MATTAIVGAFDKTYESNYNYTYDGNSYAKWITMKLAILFKQG